MDCGKTFSSQQANNRPMEKLKSFLGRGPDASLKRTQRQKAFYALLSSRLPAIRLTLFIVGYLWMLLLPIPSLSRGTYIDENALQPGQVNTNWNWGEVHRADMYLRELENLRDSNATSQQKANFLEEQFKRLGISASIQDYRFTTNSGDSAGTNAYAIIYSPRASGTEAMVISSSWLSSTGNGDGTLNLRGVSTTLALASFLREYSLWAKDIIFVVSDGYLEGMHAWLSAYHGTTQKNLEADALNLTSGVIWTAMNIDYPGHSFSHLGIFYEGLNGRLPNQDLLNSFQHISTYTGGVPVTIYDNLDHHTDSQLAHNKSLTWLLGVVPNFPLMKTCIFYARNILKHLGYQARGRASGVHGLFHQYRIDAFTLFAVPAEGPHGFHAIGRIVESTLRTTNNLLERLHASFFFYIMTSPTTFLQIGNYLPSAVLISVAMMFGGLSKWVEAGWTESEFEKQGGSELSCWRRRGRPVISVLGIILSTHALGGFLFGVVTQPWFLSNLKIFSPALFFFITAIPPIFLSILRPRSTTGNLATLLQSLTLCFASTVISITTVLNFSLAAFLAILLGLPLSFASPSGGAAFKFLKYGFICFVALDWLLFSHTQMIQSIWDWEFLGVWFTPFICLIYTPLLLQAGVVCLLPTIS